MQETRALAEFVVRTGFADLPPPVVDDCRTAVLDALGAAYIGTAQPWAQRALDLMRELGGTAQATVIHQTWRTDVSRAAFANGVLIGAFECEPLTGSHASGTVLPAALAICERERLNGQIFLTALALGFEVSARIARTAVGLESTRGFHNPGTQGPFAAAAAVGKLYDVNAATLTSAFGLAGSCSAGLLEFAWSGADTKRLHLGRASQLGLESALLARKGLHGPATVLEGRYGYYQAFSEPTDLQPLLEGLGTHWAIQPPALKSYATHVTHQAVVQAIQDWKQATVVQPQQITRVAIYGTPRIMEERHAVRNPHTVMGGQYSLPFTTAVALTRDMADPLVYNREAMQDPLVRDLATRIELYPDAALPSGHGVFPATLHIEAAGQTYILPTRPHKGSPQNPLTWAEAGEKFRRFTRHLLPREQATTIIDAIQRLEHTTDMAEIARLVGQKSDS